MENKPTYEELLDRVTEMELDLEALKTELLNANSREQSKPAPPHPRWKPEEGEYYYWFNGRGAPAQDKWIASACDQDLYNIGNVFFNLKTTKFAVERLKVLAQMREWAGAIDDPWHIYYDSRHKKVFVGEWTITRLIYGDLRFATEDDARNCINAVGLDRIQRYYFMIDENGDPMQV